MRSGILVALAVLVPGGTLSGTVIGDGDRVTIRSPNGTLLP